MRLKVKLSFLILGMVLVLAGVTSYIELTRLTSSVQVLIDNGARSISLSKGVLDIIQEMNTGILGSTEHRNLEFTELSESDEKLMDSLFIQAANSYPESAELDKVAAAKVEYQAVLDLYTGLVGSDEAFNSYITRYIEAYNNFTNSIKEFMLSSQDYVVSQTERLRGDIYRTTMQSVVALSVSVVILFVFFLMFDVFYIKPVISMNKALDKYITSGTSFNVNVEGKDEPKQLRESIMVLIRQLKNKS